MDATEAWKQAESYLKELRSALKEPTSEDGDLEARYERLRPLNEMLLEALRVLRGTSYSASAQIKSWDDAQSPNTFLRKINFNTWLGEPTEEDFWDRLGTLTPERYFHRLQEAQCFVTAAELPEDLETLFDEAKRCYALGMSNSVACLCRAILERTVRDICLRTERIPESRFNLRRDDPEYPHFHRMLDRAGASGSFRERVADHHRLLCGFVHAERTACPADSFYVLNHCVTLVAQLYRINRNHSAFCHS